MNPGSNLLPHIASADILEAQAAKVLHHFSDSDSTKGKLAQVSHLFKILSIKPVLLNGWNPEPEELFTAGTTTAADLLAEPFYKEPFFPFTREELTAYYEDETISKFRHKVSGFFNPADVQGVDNFTAGKDYAELFMHVAERVEALDVHELCKEYHADVWPHVQEHIHKAHERRAAAADDPQRLFNTIRVFASLFAKHVFVITSRAQERILAREAAGEDIEAAIKDFQAFEYYVKPSTFYALLMIEFTLCFDGKNQWLPFLGAYTKRLEETAPELCKAADEYAMHVIEEATNFRYPDFLQLVEAYDERHRKEENEARRQKLKADGKTARTAAVKTRKDAADNVAKTVFGLGETIIKRNSRNPAPVTVKKPTKKYHGVTTGVRILDIGKDARLSNGEPIILDPVHFEVFNALCSTWKKGNEYTSLSNLYKTMTGQIRDRTQYRGTQKEASLTPERRADLKRRLIDMALTWIEIDVSEENAHFKGLTEEDKKLTYSGPLIKVEMLEEADLNGNVTADVIHINGLPRLYTHAERLKQIASYSIDMLNVPIRNTDDVIALKGILLRVINIKGSSGKAFHEIGFDKLYDYMCVDPNDKSTATKKRRVRIRDNAKICLDFWKEKKYITSYNFVKEGNVFKKIVIRTPRHKGEPAEE